MQLVKMSKSTLIYSEKTVKCAKDNFLSCFIVIPDGKFIKIPSEIDLDFHSVDSRDAQLSFCL